MYTKQLPSALTQRQQYIPYMAKPSAPQPSLYNQTIDHVVMPIFKELRSLPPIPFIIDGVKYIYIGGRDILDNKIDGTAVMQLTFGSTLAGLLLYNYLS